MFDAIKKLDRDTIAKDYGLKNSTNAMNGFCEVMLEPKKSNPESYLNRLLWITCYSGLNDDLRKRAEKKIREVEVFLSKNRVLETNTKIR